MPLSQPTMQPTAISILETVTLLSILCLATFSLYKFKHEDKAQIAAVYASTSITLLTLLGGIIITLLYLLQRLKKTRANVEDYALLSLNEAAVTNQTTEVTYSIVERPTPEPPPTPLHSSSDTDSDPISLKKSDNQSESSPHNEDCVTYPAEKDKDDTIPLLEKHLETVTVIK